MIIHTYIHFIKIRRGKYVGFLNTGYFYLPMQIFSLFSRRTLFCSLPLTGSILCPCCFQLSRSSGFSLLFIHLYWHAETFSIWNCQRQLICIAVVECLFVLSTDCGWLCFRKLISTIIRHMYVRITTCLTNEAPAIKTGKIEDKLRWTNGLLHSRTRACKYATAEMHLIFGQPVRRNFSLWFDI